MRCRLLLHMSTISENARLIASCSYNTFFIANVLPFLCRSVFFSQYNIRSGHVLTKTNLASIMQLHGTSVSHTDIGSIIDYGLLCHNSCCCTANICTVSACEQVHVQGCTPCHMPVQPAAWLTCPHSPPCSPSGVSLTIHAADTVGLVGLSGSAQSSMLLSLFRMVELQAGSIAMDGVDISTVGLHQLRPGACPSSRRWGLRLLAKGCSGVPVALGT